MRLTENTQASKDRALNKINNLIEAFEILGRDITEAVRLSFLAIRANDSADICEVEFQTSELIGNDTYLNDMIDCVLETENN